MTAAGVREPVPPGGFAGFLQSRNLISGDLFLTSIELGNEVITGTGRTEVRAYKVTIN